MRVHFTDNFSYGEHHMKFNASLLSSVIASGADVIYRSTPSSRKKVFQYLDTESIGKIKIKNTIVLHGEYGMWIHARRILNQILNILSLFLVKREDVIVFNQNPWVMFRLFNVLCRILQRKVLVCCHMELDVLCRKPEERGRFGKIVFRIISNPRIKIARHLRFAVLGDNIKEGIREMLPPNIASHFVSFDHPFIFDREAHNKPLAGENFSAGSISLLTTKRGKAFLNVVKYLGKDFAHKHIRAVGRIYDHNLADELKEAGVDLSGDLPREEYDRQIKNLDYVLFFYPVESYKFGVSGALFDALSYNKPIIGLSCGYLKYVENKFGSIGILCDSEKDMAETLLKLSSGSLSVSVNFSELKQHFTPKAISSQLMEIFSSL